MSKCDIGSAVIMLCLGLLPVSGSSQEGSPAGTIPTEILEARRQGVLDALKGAPAIFTSAGPRGDYAQDSDYRENNDFFYLTGLEAPGAWLVLNGGAVDEAVLFLPPRSVETESWTGPKPAPENGARTLTGLAHIRSTAELEEEIPRWFGGAEDRGTPGSGPLFASFGDPRFEEVLKSYLPVGAPEIQPLAPVMASLRVVKDAEELRRLRRAVDITAEAHKELWRLAQPGLSEYHLEAALEYVFKVQGAERLGFPSIVGSGPNSVILHYDENRRGLEVGDLVVVDIGAEFGYYTADLTRTFPADGHFSPRQKALYDLVLGAREAGLEMIRPGSTIREVNQAARAFLESQSGELCGEPSCAPFLIHGVCHWLGMDVHDVGDNRSPFLPGMVLTLEPGLYLPEETLGIRVEDDILVTETGHEVLSADLPRSTEEIEATMGEEPRWIQSHSSWLRN